MAETLAIVASTIAVVELAYKSTKSLVDFLESLRNAPALISELKGDVKATLSILESINVILENRDDRNLPRELRLSLASAHVPIKDCEAVCNEFEQKLKEWFCDSAWDRLKANFKEAKIEKFRTRLRDTRNVLDLALNLCSIKFNGLRAEDAHKFEVEMESQVQRMSGKLEGLEISRQEFLDAAQGLSEQNHQLSFQQGEIARRLIDHERLLREAIKLCSAGLVEIENKTGSRVRLAKTLDEARQIVMVVGNVTGDVAGGIEINTLIAENKSRQVAITDDTEFALKFLTS